MLGFLGKIIANIIAMVVAAWLLVVGCIYVGSASIKSAEEAKRRFDANRPAAVQEDRPAVERPAPSPVASVFNAAEKSFARSVADDLIEQYDIVKGGSDEMAKSIRAGAVAEMFLQAKDSSNYELWKSRADSHMKKALGQ
jgi:hypothetical protein